MQSPAHFLRLFFFIFVRGVVLVLLGLNVRRRHLLPQKGSAIIVANHNSHLDALVLASLFPLRLLPHIRPIAAADYFLRTPFMSWFSERIIGIVPVARGGSGKGGDPLAPCHEAIERGDILILFPEGTRGEPEKLSHFKKGVAHLAAAHPGVPVAPVFMHGLGKALPKGDFVLVPFFCDVFVGESLQGQEEINAFMAALNERFRELAAEGHFLDAGE